jgi:hypothetical protein
VNLYDARTAPSVFDVVWCKLPRREDKLGPGPWVRPVLVIDVRLMVDIDETEWAAITVAYGTGADNVPMHDRKGHLVIGEHEYHALGLHKPTVFKIDLQNRKRLPWAEEYFVPQSYVRNRKIIAGSLNEAQQEAFYACFKERGFKFPLP